jgi:hypothetical protein
MVAVEVAITHRGPRNVAIVGVSSENRGYVGALDPVEEFLPHVPAAKTASLSAVGTL